MNALLHCYVRWETKAETIYISEVEGAIGKIYLFGDKVASATREQAFMLPDGARYVEWGYSDKSLRLFATDTKKVGLCC